MLLQAGCRSLKVPPCIFLPLILTSDIYAAVRLLESCLYRLFRRLPSFFFQRSREIFVACLHPVYLRFRFSSGCRFSLLRFILRGIIISPTFAFSLVFVLFFMFIRIDRIGGLLPLGATRSAGVLVGRICRAYGGAPFFAGETSHFEARGLSI